MHDNIASSLCVKIIWITAFSTVSTSDLFIDYLEYQKTLQGIKINRFLKISKSAKLGKN